MSPFDNIIELSSNNSEVPNVCCLRVSCRGVAQCVLCMAVSNIYADNNDDFDDRDIASKTSNCCETN